MNRSRPVVRRTSTTAPSTTATFSSEAAAGLERLLLLLAAALFLCRFFVPAESAEDGETLWIVVGWLLLLSIWGVLAIRGDIQPLSMNVSGLVVLGLCMAHVISAAAILLTEGNQRTALTMLWEWIGIAVAFVLLHKCFSAARERRRLVMLLLSTGVTIALLGIWQHAFWYPQLGEMYREWKSLTDTRSVDNSMTAAQRQQRIQELQQSLGPEMLSLQGASRIAFEQRLLASTEPIGRFALANTLGGVLAAMVVLGVGTLWPSFASLPRKLQLLGLILLISVTFCLLLTKSRSAWIAVVLGGLGIVASRQAIQQIPVSLLLKRSLILLLVVGVLVGVMVWTGSWDRYVITEAPKSLTYRLQYWTGAWQVIQGSPFWGTGPGNFRQHYLQFKAPEASEEISDPHNLILDAWANAGWLGLFGLAVLLGWAVRTVLRGLRQPTASDKDDETDRDKGEISWLIKTGWLAMLGIALKSYFLDGRADGPLLGCAIIWPLVCFAVASVVKPGSAMSVASLAAGTTLAVHLLVSGGFAMPAVLLLLLVLWFVIPDEAMREEIIHLSPRWGLPVALLLLAGAMSSGFLPVLTADIYRRQGTYLWKVSNNPAAAVISFQKAIDADPLDPRNWREFALLHMSIWEAGGRRAQASLSAAQLALTEMIRRDPRNAYGYRLAGALSQEACRRTKEPSACREAVQYYAQAVRLYPSSAQIRAEYALALDAANQKTQAKQQARQALDLHQINLEWWHADRFLEKTLLDQLRKIVQHDPETASIGDPCKSTWFFRQRAMFSRNTQRVLPRGNEIPATDCRTESPKHRSVETV